MNISFVPSPFGNSFVSKLRSIDNKLTLFLRKTILIEELEIATNKSPPFHSIKKPAVTLALSLSL